SRRGLPVPWRVGPRSSSVRRFTIAPERLGDGRVAFDRDESHHLARVLRLRPGDTVIAADGAGREYTVRLETVGEEATGSVLGDPADLQLCLWEGAIGDERSGSVPVATLAASLPAALPSGTHIRLLVGPEGGLSTEEVERARAHRWTIVGMGPRILRTETAGP